MATHLSTVQPTGRRVDFHIGFAVFLERVFDQDPGVPAHLFTQANVAHPDDPGDLDPHAALNLAATINALTDEQLTARMRAAYAHPDAGSMKDAIACVRDIAELATYAAEHGGMSVR